MAQTIYGKGNAVAYPSVDLLTLLFDTEFARATDDTPVYAEAHDPVRSIITRGRARALTKQIAYFLRKNYGIGASGPGKDIVVTISSGQSVLPCAFYGVIAAEGIYSAASSTATVGDLTRQVKDGPANVIICSRDVSTTAVEAAKAAGLPAKNVLILESWPHLKLESADGSVKCDWKGELPWRAITDPKELEKSKICILYSSGTTGLPKGVLVSHTNVVAEVNLLSTVSRPHYDIEERVTGKPFNRRTLGHLPAAHIAGVQGYFVNVIYEGGIVYWMPKFDLELFLKYCDELEITFFFTVPPIYMAIAKHPLVKNQFRHMRAAASGAAPLSADLQKAATTKLHGAEITQVWGLSETTGAATHFPAGWPLTFGSLGILVPNCTMRLVDDDGKDVPKGQAGEALIKGPIVTQGYHNNPEANKNSFTADGWYCTGDILMEKNDEFYVVDRKKELIKYNGLQVAPAELEGLIANHPAIADAAVIGFNYRDTEAPRAYVVRAPSPAGQKITEDDVAKHVADNVAPYKQLRGGVVFVDAVPRSPAGKILRKELREWRKRDERSGKL